MGKDSIKLQIANQRGCVSRGDANMTIFAIRQSARKLKAMTRDEFAFQSTLPARGATAQSNNSVDQNHRLCTKSIPQNSPFEN